MALWWLFRWHLWWEPKALADLLATLVDDPVVRDARAAPVPPPRFNLVRYHGVLAPRRTSARRGRAFR